MKNNVSKKISSYLFSVIVGIPVLSCMTILVCLAFCIKSILYNSTAMLFTGDVFEGSWSYFDKAFDSIIDYLCKG